MRVVVMAVSDRDEHDLLGREPDRESAAIMFDQDAKEAFHAAEEGAMDHVGAVLLAIFADVAEVEAFRQVEVELDSRKLPFPTQCVLDLEVDLWTIERAAAFVNLVGMPMRIRVSSRSLSVAHIFRRRRSFRVWC